MMNKHEVPKETVKFLLDIHCHCSSSQLYISNAADVLYLFITF